MVDLTKPLRLKVSNTPCYLVLGLIDEWDRQAVVIGRHGEYKFVPLDALENSPEPVSRYLAVRLYANGLMDFEYDDRTSAAHKIGYAVLKLTRTEDGKTRVEIIDD